MSDDAKSVATTRTNATKQAPKEEPPEAEKTAVEEDNEDKGLMHFIWNSDKKEFCGRSGSSWLLITIFYLIFFASLASLFILFWNIAKITIKEDAPYRSNKDSLLCRGDAGPGLAIRPTTDRVENPASSVIWFGTDTFDEYGFWSGQLRMWFNKMPKHDAKHVKKCTSIEDGATKEHACYINSNQFSRCAPLEHGHAKWNDFGYVRAEPCILLKLNRIYDWKPEALNKDYFESASSDEVSQGLKNYVTKHEDLLKENVMVWCEGEHDHDKENLGPVEYFPGPYIPIYYFPFLNQKNFQTPFVALQLKRPLPGALISIVCKAYAKNLKPSRESESGYIRFQVLSE